MIGRTFTLSLISAKHRLETTLTSLSLTNICIFDIEKKKEETKQTNEKTKTRERNEKLITHLLLPSQQSVVLQLHAVSLFIAHTSPR